MHCPFWHWNPEEQLTPVQASIKTQRPFWQKYPLEQSTFKQLFTETHWPFLHVWLA